MANPRKVLDFLDVAGNWDPSMLLVMGGAIAVTAITALSNLSAEAFVFVAAMILGGILGKIPARLSGSLAQR